MEKQYSITREQCQAKIDKRDVVCSGCGGQIVPIDTVNNGGEPTFWEGCEVCQRFDSGVSKKVFNIARKMVVDHNFEPYEYDEDIKRDHYDYWLSSRIYGTTGFVSKILELAKQEEIQ